MSLELESPGAELAASQALSVGKPSGNFSSEYALRVQGPPHSFLVTPVINRNDAWLNIYTKR